MGNKIQIGEPEAQKRLDDLTAQATQKVDLNSQRGIVLYLLERSLQDGGPLGVSNALLNTSMKLETAHMSMGLRSSRVLTREAAVRFAKELLDAVDEVLRKLPISGDQHADCLDAVARRLAMSLDKAHNEPDEILRIEHGA